MILDSFHITNYKRIKDSGVVRVTSPLTLVGQNECGKTSIIEALYKFNNSDGVSFNIDTDWPRDARELQSDKAQVVKATFSLSDEDVEACSIAMAQPCPIRSITIARKYDGGLVAILPSGADGLTGKLALADLEMVRGSLKETYDQVRPAFAAAWLDFRTTLLKTLSEQDFVSRNIGTDKLLARLKSIVAKPLSPDEAPLAPHEAAALLEIESSLANLSEVLVNLNSPRQRFLDTCVARMPSFILFGYDSFVGTCQLDELARRVKENQTSASDRSVLTILHLSGLDLDNLVKLGSSLEPRDKVRRKLDLADAGQRLTRLVAPHWSQRDNEVIFDADGATFTTFIKTRDETEHIRLEERSEGFRWFFSFDLLFLRESEDRHKNSVVLLDEPGLHLHPRAQTDLLSRIKAYAKDCTIILTTHLPFMIDLSHPEQIRVVSDETGSTTVSERLFTRAVEDRLVLAAAVGISARESYLVAERNLVVEGPDDFWIIARLSRLAEDAKKTHIESDVRITPGPSASEAVPLAAFISGQGLSVSCLFDADAEGVRAKEKLEQYWSKNMPLTGKIVMMDEVVKGLGHPATLEDLLTDEFFSECVWDIYGQDLINSGMASVKSLSDDTTETLKARVRRIVDGILGEGSFSEAKVMARIRKRLAEINAYEEVPARMAENFENLFVLVSRSWPTQKAKPAMMNRKRSRRRRVDSNTT